MLPVPFLFKTGNTYIPSIPATQPHLFKPTAVGGQHLIHTHPANRRVMGVALIPPG